MSENKTNNYDDIKLNNIAIPIFKALAEIHKEPDNSIWGIYHEKEKKRIEEAFCYVYKNLDRYPTETKAELFSLLVDFNDAFVEIVEQVEIIAECVELSENVSKGEND